jgi:CheY-like chemotaxis protein
MGKKILIIEDNGDNSKLMGKILGYYKYEVKIVVNGKEALEYCKSDTADLILADITLPDINGLELAKQIKQIGSYANTPIVAVTAHTRSEVEKEVVNAGCVNMLAKPFEPNELVKIVE